MIGLKYITNALCFADSHPHHHRTTFRVTPYISKINLFTPFQISLFPFLPKNGISLLFPSYTMSTYPPLGSFSLSFCVRETKMCVSCISLNLLPYLLCERPPIVSILSSDLSCTSKNMTYTPFCQVLYPAGIALKTNIYLTFWCFGQGRVEFLCRLLPNSSHSHFYMLWTYKLSAYFFSCPSTDSTI